jgi:uncharacterized glyoxalase superfamily protein PhnB
MNIHPTLRYTDAPAAIDFLTEAFGLVAGPITTSDDGSVQHAVLSWGEGAVLVSSRSDDAFDTGRAVLYLTTADPDGLHERAAAAGAPITYGLTDQPYGSREFGASDPEGNVWCFGTYTPAPA